MQAADNLLTARSEIHPVSPHAFEADVLALNGPCDFMVHGTADKISEAREEPGLERHVALHTHTS